MKMPRLVVAVLVLSLLIAGITSAAPGPKATPPGQAKVKLHKRGDAFCPRAALVAGGVVIRSGRCYTTYLLRDTRGTFLAFAPAGALIPPGQIVRLNTPAGAKVRGQLFYRVPIRTVSSIPVNSLTLVSMRVEDYGTRTSLVIVDPFAPGIVVIFTVRP